MKHGNPDLSTSNVGDHTQCSEDSFTFKKKGALDTTQTTNNSLFSKASSKFRVRNFRKKREIDNKNILGDNNEVK